MQKRQPLRPIAVQKETVPGTVLHKAPMARCQPRSSREKTGSPDSGSTQTLQPLLKDVDQHPPVFGFERSDLRTLSFNVDTEYESYKEKRSMISQVERARPSGAIVTGYEQHKEEAYRAGAAGFVLKPYSEEEIRAELKKLY